jgi:hypothetical protein
VLVPVSLVLLAGTACKAPPDPRRTNFKVEGPGIVVEYDDKTGRMKKVDMDQDKNGRFETWSYWDATRLIRIEIDKDEDGRIERWEHFDEKRKLTKIGSSSRDDAIEDTWTYPDAQGFLARVETDTDRDGVIDRRETFVATTGPQGRVLSVVELGLDAAGRPAQRLYYRPDGAFDRAETVRR